MEIAFEVPCVVRARQAGSKKLWLHVTSTSLVVDVPVIDEREVEMVYIAELGRRSDGYTSFHYNDGCFYSGTAYYDNATARDGWQESPWQARTPIYSRLWNALLEDLLSRPYDHNVVALASAIATTLSGIDTSHALRERAIRAHRYKATRETAEDLEAAKQRAACILRDVVISRRQLYLRTGQPCYAVHLMQGKARIAIGTTEVHERLRSAAFANETVFPTSGFSERIDGLRHYFPIEEHDAMLAFVEAAGDKMVGSVPKASRLQWATHDENIDAIEIDRIARIAIQETAASAMTQMPSLLLGGRSGFLEAFNDLKCHLVQRHDPDQACEETARKLAALCAVASEDTQGPPLLDPRLQAFFSRGLSRFENRRISSLEFLPATGSLPQPQ
ncbi:hypothetical protein O9X98_14915 [Agrobacterium salinitolerans]|nr:hypothetical protein [Agrobacterium salinitolerans]